MSRTGSRALDNLLGFSGTPSTGSDPLDAALGIGRFAPNIPEPSYEMPGRHPGMPPQHPGVVTGGNRQNLQTVKDFFLQKGLPEHVAAAIAGNIAQESGGNPSAVNKQSGAFGLAQDLGPRKQALFALAQQMGADPSDMGVQLQHMWNEMHGGDRGATLGLQQMLQTNNVNDATMIFANKFERMGQAEANFPNRIATAQSFMGGPQQAAPQAPPPPPQPQQTPINPTATPGTAPVMTPQGPKAPIDMWQNFVSGLERFGARTAEGLGSPEAAANWRAAAERGAVTPEPHEGPMPSITDPLAYAQRVGQEINENLLQPLAGMAGEFIPAALPIGRAAKVLSMLPAAKGEIQEYGRDLHHEIDPMLAGAAGIPLAALEALGLPAMRGLKGVAEALSPEVESGIMNRILGAGKEMGSHTAQNFAAMEAMQAIKQAAAGESPIDKNPLGTLESAAWFAGMPATAKLLGPREARMPVEETPVERPEAQREPVQEMPIEQLPVQELPVQELPPEAPPTSVSDIPSEPPLGPTPTPEAPTPRPEAKAPHWTDEFPSQKGNRMARLRQLDIENPEHWSPIINELDGMTGKKTKPEDYAVIKKYRDLAAANLHERDTRKPTTEEVVQEIQNAQQKPEAGPVDGGGSAQPIIRQESRDQAVSSQGVEPSRQRQRTPEVVPETQEAPPGWWKEFGLKHEQKGSAHERWARELDALNPYDAKDFMAMQPVLDTMAMEKRLQPKVEAFQDKFHNIHKDAIQTSKERAGHWSSELGLEDSHPLKEIMSVLDIEDKDHHGYIADMFNDLLSQKETAKLRPTIEQLTHDHKVEGVLSAKDMQKEIQKPERPIVTPEKRAKRVGRKLLIEKKKELLDKGEIDEVAPVEEEVAGISPERDIHRQDYKSLKPEELDALHKEDLQRAFKALHDEPITEDATADTHPMATTLNNADWVTQQAKQAFDDAMKRNDPEAADAAARSFINNKHRLVGYALRHANGVAREMQRRKMEAKPGMAGAVVQSMATKANKMLKAESDHIMKQLKALEDRERVRSAYESRDAMKKAVQRDLDEAESRGETRGEKHTPETLREALRSRYGDKMPMIEIGTRTEKHPEGTHAVYNKNTRKVTLFADQIGKDVDLHGLLRHEIGVHANRLGKSDKEFQGMLRHMESIQKSDKRVAEAFERVPKDTHPDLRTEEAMAYLVQHHPEMPLVRRFMSWLRRLAHRVTGHAGWLKGEDLVVMAEQALKGDKGPAGRPERKSLGTPEVRSEKDLLEQVRNRPGGPLTVQMEPVTFREASTERGVKVRNFFTGDPTKQGIYGTPGKMLSRFRAKIVDRNDPLTLELQNLPTFNKETGELRADFHKAQADQGIHIITQSMKMGTPVFNESGAIRIKPTRDNLENLKNNLKELDKRIPGATEMWADALRTKIGAYRIEQEKAARDRINTILKSSNEDNRPSNLRTELAQLRRDFNIPEGFEDDVARKHSGIEHMITDADIARMHEIEKIEPIKNMMDMTHRIMRDLADFYHDSGMIKDEEFQEWQKAPYIPLYKSLSDLTNMSPEDLKQAKIISHRSAADAPAIKWSGQQVNVMENLQRHYYQMMVPAIINKSKKMALQQLMDVGSKQVKEVKPHELKRLSSTDKEQLVTVKSGKGVERYQILDPYLRDALAFKSPLIHPVLELFNWGSGIVRTMAIKTPTFFLKQIPGETMSAILMSGTKHGGIPGIPNLIKNITTAMLNSNQAVSVLRQHGMLTGMHDFVDKFASSYAGFEQKPALLSPARIPGVGKPIVKAWDKYTDVLGRVDEGVRAHVYEMAMKDGKDLGLEGQHLEDYAVSKARTFLNFTTHGASEWANVYRKMYVFSGSALNGMDSMLKNMTGYGLNKQEASVVRQKFWTTAVSMATVAAGWNLYQLQNNPNFAKYLSDSEEDSSLLFKVFDDGDVVRLTLPWEGGLIANTVPLLVMRGLMGALGEEAGISPKEAAGRILKQLTETTVPPFPITPQVDVRQGDFDVGFAAVLPSAIAPVAEAIMGYNPRRNAPMESSGTLRTAPEFRTGNATPTAQWLADTFQIDPIKADHILRGYFVEAYGMINAFVKNMQQSNALASGTTKDMLPMSTVGEIPTARIVLSDKYKVRDMDKAYKVVEEAEQYRTAYNNIRKEGNEEKFNKFMKDTHNRVYASYAPMLGEWRRKLGDTENQIRALKSANYDEATKKQVYEQLLDNKQKMVDVILDIDRRIQEDMKATAED